jgi:hypothetical protein
LIPYGAKLADPDLSQLVAPGQRYAGVGPTTGIEFADPALLLGGAAGTGPRRLVGRAPAALGRRRRHWLRPGAAAGRAGRAADGDRGPPRLAEGLPGPVAEIVRACLAPPADRPAAAAVADRVAAVAADMAAVAAASSRVDGGVGSAPALARAPG